MDVGGGMPGSLPSAMHRFEDGFADAPDEFEVLVEQHVEEHAGEVDLPPEPAHAVTACARARKHKGIAPHIWPVRKDTKINEARNTISSSNS